MRLGNVENLPCLFLSEVAMFDDRRNLHSKCSLQAELFGILEPKICENISRACNNLFCHFPIPFLNSS